MKRRNTEKWRAGDSEDVSLFFFFFFCLNDPAVLQKIQGAMSKQIGLCIWIKVQTIHAFVHSSEKPGIGMIHNTHHSRPV